jgi:hypothetical protein
MGTTTLDRRQLLKGLGAGALAAGAAVTLSPTNALAEDDHEGATGAWTVNIHETDQPSRQAAVGLAAGGVFTTTDSLGPGAVGVGAWKHEGHNKVAFKFTVYDFSRGTPGVTVVVSGSGTVSGNSIAGTFTVTVFGNQVASGTFDGTRMTV